MNDEKPVSYVQLMREIRDQVNREISGLTFEEQQRWMQEQLANAPAAQSRNRAALRKRV